MTETSYQVKTTHFEGPLEVLLNLIEKRKLFVNEISLAAITDDYITYVRGFSTKDMERYASFVTVAATLILIKSRSLIPNLSLTVEEEHDISTLERRLELYKIIKDIGEPIARMFGKRIVFPRLPTKLETRVFVPDAQISLTSMREGIGSVINSIPEPEPAKPEVVVMKIRSLEETISDLVERVSRSMKMSFREFSGSQGFAKGKEEKVGTIVSFLAMLELVRQGFMDAFQDGEFADISLEKISQ